VSEFTSGQVKQRRAEIDHKDLDLKSKEQKVEQLSVQLNQVRTNKEYAALQHEIANVKADASLLEDEVLALMELIDRDERDRRAHDAKVKEAEQAAQRAQEEVNTRSAEVDGRIQSLRGERETFQSGMERELRELYERLFQSKEGQAVVKAIPAGGDERSCSGCFIRLTSNTTNLLMAGQKMIRCHSCGRILYIDDDEREAAEAAGL
jgi:uncharacterized protein